MLPLYAMVCVDETLAIELVTNCGAVFVSSAPICAAVKAIIGNLHFIELAHRNNGSVLVWLLPR